jgi:uncharacterized membrane protein YkvI
MDGKLKKTAELMTLIFALAVFCVMAACCGEMGNMIFGIKNIYGALIMCAMCCAVMMFKTDDALLVNAIIGGIIAVGIITCCLYLLRYREHQAFLTSGKMLAASVSYSGYNLLTAGVILARLAPRLRNRKEAYLAAFSASFAMLVIMIVMWGLLSIYYGKISLGEIPMLTMAIRENKFIAAAYSGILFFAIFSTALSNGIGAINIFSKKLKRKYSAIIISAIGFCFSAAGFSTLINGVYRLCGYVGAAFLICAIMHFKTFLKKVK